MVSKAIFAAMQNVKISENRVFSIHIFFFQSNMSLDFLKKMDYIDIQLSKNLSHFP